MKHISFLTAIFGLAFLLVFFTLPKPSAAANTQTSSFTFTAVGDYGATANTSAVLDGISAAKPAFNLAIGDMSYGDLQPESNWCNYIKSHVGSTFPFEVLAGNHDDGTSATDGTIVNFAACLPDRLGNIHGTYAKEYYFDYPASAPLARFIFVSPRIEFTPGSYFYYTADTAHYNWVQNAIDSARAANIPWVIVAMHRHCIGAGNYGCEVDTDLFNLLISKKVDLILQGHDHNYERSKQLAAGAACAAVSVGSYNSACVVDNGLSGRYTKGRGTIIVIAGTGGFTSYDINTADPEIGYFAAYMGSNMNKTYGFMSYTVTNTSLSGTFVPAAVGTYTDHFVIERSGQGSQEIYLPFISR